MSTQQVMEQVTAPATYAAAGGTVIAGLALGEWAAVIGIIVTLSTFALNWWYRHQMLKQTRS